jgi:hypothetical protein
MRTPYEAATWRCGHLYPIVVSAAEGGKKRARCLGCEATGPLRAEAPEAMWALREEGKSSKIASTRAWLRLGADSANLVLDHARNFGCKGF